MSLPIYNRANGLKWVFLDLDDTLWDFSANSINTLKELFHRYEYLSEIFGSFDAFSGCYHIINDRMWKLYQRGEIDAATLKRMRFELLLADHMDAGTARHEASILQHEYLSRLGEGTILVEGAEELLRTLASKYLIGILSNGFREVQYRKLYGGPLWKYVQRMVLSDEIGVNKPDTRLFRYAELATGADAAATLMVGDNPEADIAGALSAGWHAIYFDRKNTGITPEGAATVSTLADVAALLL